MRKEIAIPVTRIRVRDEKDTYVTYTVSREVGEKLQENLAHLAQHLFIRILEIQATINTSDIKRVWDDVETKVQYEPDPAPERDTPAERKRAREKLATIKRELVERGVFKA